MIVLSVSLFIISSSFAVVKTRDLPEEGNPTIGKHDGINKLTAANPAKIRVRVMKNKYIVQKSNLQL
jgi:hypothetical protein